MQPLPALGEVRAGHGLRRLTTSAIRVYQWVISPILGPHCRFQPTCSEYALQAISHYGVLRGIRMGFARILHCHPWHPGGYDPVPGTDTACEPHAR